MFNSEVKCAPDAHSTAPTQRILKGELKFVNHRLKRKRNLLKVGYNILATLSEAICGNSDCKQVGELDEDKTISVECEGLQLPQTDKSHLIFAVDQCPWIHKF